MKPKTLASLGVLTVVVAAAAAWVATRTPPGVAAGRQADGPLLATLRERVNDVAEVQVTTASESFTLRRQEGTWGLVDKGGYPVDVGKVKELVLGLAELTLVEEKTANPQLWHRLGVQDPGSDPEATSKRVRLSTDDGSVLADIVVGRAETAGGPGRSSVYVRRVEAGPALEALGRVQLPERSADLLDRQVAKLERKRVHEVTLTHPDGETLRVLRESPDLTDFDVADLPEGAELSWAGVAGGVAGALEYLTLQDVLPAGEADFDPAQAVRARFTTFDGLVVTARTLEREGDVLLTVAAEYDESERSEEPVGPPPPEGQDAEPATAAAGKSPEEVAAEADEINARTAGWVYVVPGYSGANLRKRLQDLLKQPEEQVEGLFGEEPGELLPGEPLPGEGDGAPTAAEQPVDEPATGGDPDPAGGDGAPPAAQQEPAGQEQPVVPEQPAGQQPAGGEPAGGEPAGGEPGGGEPGGGGR